MPIKRSEKLYNHVLERDRNICQCCYRSAGGIAVHHIHGLAQGGKDDVNNMVVVCDDCHTGAPIDPNEFLAYQRDRGLGGLLMFAQLCLNASKRYPNMPVSLIREQFEKNCLDAFDRYWYENSVCEREARKKAKYEEAESKRQTILSYLLNQKGEWVPQSELAKELKEFSTSRMLDLVSRKLVQSEVTVSDGRSKRFYKAI